MDYFCKDCATKPGWLFDQSKAFKWACQRCFRYMDVNDYAYRKTELGIPVSPGPAAEPKDLVKSQVNPHAQVDLPVSKAVDPTPQPVYPVAAPGDKALSQDDLLVKLQGSNPKGIKMEVTKK